MRSNKYGIIGKAFFEEGRKILKQYHDRNPSDKYVISLDEMLNVLTHCHRHEELIYEALPPSREHIGGDSVPYSRHQNYAPLIRKKHPDIFFDDELPFGYYTLLEYFTADNSLEGAWEYFLLSKITRFLPMFWHAAYGEQNFIFDLDDYPETVMLQFYKHKEGKIDPCYSLPEKQRSSERVDGFGYIDDSDVAIALSIKDNPLLLPQLQYFDEKEIRIRYSFFNMWTGLYRETVRAKRLDERFYFYSIDSERITRFDCGWIL